MVARGPQNGRWGLGFWTLPNSIIFFFIPSLSKSQRIDTDAIFVTFFVCFIIKKILIINFIQISRLVGIFLRAVPELLRTSCCEESWLLSSAGCSVWSVVCIVNLLSCPAHKSLNTDKQNLLSVQPYHLMECLLQSLPWLSVVWLGLQLGGAWQMYSCLQVC